MFQLVFSLNSHLTNWKIRAILSPCVTIRGWNHRYGKYAYTHSDHNGLPSTQVNMQKDKNR